MLSDAGVGITDMWKSDRILHVFFTCMVMLLLLDWCTDILSSFVFQLVLACLDFDMTASNAMWDEVVRLNAEFGIDNIGSPHPHTPPSSSAIEVDPVS